MLNFRNILKYKINESSHKIKDSIIEFIMATEKNDIKKKLSIFT